MLFHFKEFAVKQSASAMKVSTDGVLLGAWTPVGTGTRILDVGAGTGLLSLMLAQRTKSACIEAVEIDEAAYGECCENFWNSAWRHRLKAYFSSFQDFVSAAMTGTKGYDLIISNPPFYTANYKAPAAARHIARSAEALPFEVLLEGVSKLLVPLGYFSVIIPYAEEGYFIGLAADYGLYLQQGLHTKGSEYSAIKRSLLLFGKEAVQEPAFDTLTIEISRGEYTSAYQSLTKDFYLKF